MKIKRVQIQNNLNQNQCETISNIIHDVLIDMGIDTEFNAWSIDVDYEEKEYEVSICK
tara:strand:+ start:91 stop:264 length:174 start_codon:yes stop_codon:yes gene_type:complete